MSAAYEPRPPLLRVSAVSKHYAAPVLRDIDLDVHAGEVLALTGENGAGKSTLSKILCGLETATSGSMTLAGTLYAPDSRSSAEALGVRMVLQELSMVPTLTVAENLFLGDWVSWIALRCAFGPNRRLRAWAWTSTPGRPYTRSASATGR